MISPPEVCDQVPPVVDVLVVPTVSVYVVPDFINVVADDLISTLLPAPIATIPVVVFNDILFLAFINISAKDISVRFFVTFKSKLPPTILDS